MKISIVGIALLLAGSCIHAQQLVTTPNLSLQLPQYGQTNWQVPLQYDLYRLDSYVLQVPPSNGIPYYSGNGVSRDATPSDIQALLGQAGANSPGYLSTADWNRFNNGLGNSLAAPGSAGIIKWTGSATTDASTGDIVTLLNGSSTLSLSALGVTSLNLNQGAYTASLEPAASMTASYTWHWPSADGNGVLLVNGDQITTLPTLPLGYVATTVSTDPSGSCTNTATLEINSNSPYDVSACLNGTWQVVAKGGGAGGGISTLNATNPVTGSISGSTLNLSLATVPVTLGGTGAITAAAALTNLGAQPAGNYLTALTGDGTASGPGSATFSLATVNGAPGQCGDGSHLCQVTTDSKGRVVNQAQLAITGLPGGVNVQTASYTLQASDAGRLVAMNCSAACSVTLSATPAASFFTTIESIGSVLATVSLNGKQFNGATSVPALNNYRPFYVWSDGTNYYGDTPLVAGSNVSFSPAANGLTISASVSSTGGNLSNGEIFSGTSQTGNQADVIWNNNATPPNGHNMFALISTGSNGLTFQIPNSTYSDQVNFATGSGNNNIWSIGNQSNSSNLIINTWNGSTATNVFTLTRTNAVSTLHNTLDDGSGNATISGNLTVSGTVSGAGVSGGSAGPFGYFQATASNASSQTIGTDCSTSTPCSVAVGTTITKITAPASFSVPTGGQYNDTGFIYIDPISRQLTVGTQTVATTCSGCTSVTGITNFPVGSKALYVATISSPGFGQNSVVTALADDRAPYSVPVPLTAGNCIILAPGTGSEQISVDSSCTGGSASNFNGGTITTPLTITDPGTSNPNVLALKISSPNGYNTIGMYDDLGDQWQISVGGSTAIAPLAKAFYLYDKQNSNSFFTANPTTDEVTLTPSGTNGAALTLSSASTSNTALHIKNTSTGGHNWSFTSGGAANNPGTFTFYDATAGSVEQVTNAANHLTTVNLLQLMKAIGGGGSVAAPACSSTFTDTLSVDGSGHLQFCDGTAWHTISYLN